MKHEIQQLEEILLYLATAISSRADGAAYVPIFERVERELENMRKGLSTLDRIKEMAGIQSGAKSAVNLAA